jgi:hypothetical protein
MHFCEVVSRIIVPNLNESQFPLTAMHGPLDRALIEPSYSLKRAFIEP